ncbi:MAG: hypothetical protein M1827_004206 [Pycnora praestabilis]|nr:MAG: hypothetical protein M1827_004206 [Pycnora praestabilis]
MSRWVDLQVEGADTQHRRIWTWRTRYSTRNAWGLGTGIGEGIEGPKCGRGSACLAAEDTEVEIDCDAEALAAQERELEASRLAQGYANGERQGPLGYFRQEVEGIGGVVKRKVRKRVKLGKVVDEYEDEREKREILGRERGGENRSWCAWCWRVVPGEKDLVEAGI